VLQRANREIAMTARLIIPRALLFGNPTRAAPQISPDGRRISFIAPLDGVLNIWIAPADDLTNAQPLTRDRKRGIQGHMWVQSDTHLIYFQDQDGNENHRLYVLPAAGGDVRDLTPFDNVQAQIISTSRRFPTEALVGLNHRDPHWHDVYRMDLVSGAMRLVQEHNEFAGFVADDDLRLRLAVKSTPDGGFEHLVPDGAGWKPLFHVGKDDALTTHPAGFGPPDGTVLYMLDSRGRNTAAAVALDLASGAVKLLGEHPKVDVMALEINPISHLPEAYRTDYLAPEWTVIDPAVATDFRRLKELDLGDFSLTDRTEDDRRWIVGFASDISPLSWQLYDRNSGKTTFLFAARPDLEGWPLAKLHPVVIPARDGLELVSYLTLPADIATDAAGRPPHPLPMVLLVHGGPWDRNFHGYNAHHQFLANRGYAVLSVNFRGSTGFGKAFVNAGDNEWAGRMHDDLLDAVDWAVKRGIARKDRVAIMGGSYGGYAALVGLTYTPEVFACGIDIFGPSNLETLLASTPPYWESFYETLCHRVGDPRNEAGCRLLRERSPLHLSNRIMRPLLISQGANDVRVTQAESDQLAEAMKRNGQQVIYLLYPDEGHGFVRPENRLSFMAIAEAFLAEHLGGARQDFDNDLEGSSLQVLDGADQIAGLAEALGERTVAAE
jgi:dipeptidyl aminopeptidase/acylaminoacyl peptidase